MFEILKLRTTDFIHRLIDCGM